MRCAGDEDARMPDTPLRPDEYSTYRTEVDTEGERPEPADLRPASDPRPWIGVGVVLAALFVAMLVLGIALALLTAGAS
jgi:hypothetical protein